MCPLRVILIFLSATLAAFFLLRNLKSSRPQPSIIGNDSDNDPNNSVNPRTTDSSTPPPVNRSSKVISAIGTGFWSCADMASGRYLWRHLTSSSSSSSKRSS